MARLSKPKKGTYHWEIADRQIAWCHEKRLPVIGGPLLQTRRSRLPDGGDLARETSINIVAFVSDYVENRGAALRGKGQPVAVARRA